MSDAVAAVPRDDWSWAKAEFKGAGAQIRREAWPGAASYSILLATLDAPSVLELLKSMGVTPAGFDAFEALRVESGVPRFDADFDERRFPQEVGLDDTISYTKGCYLGQEVVARIHYRGHVNHELRALRGGASKLPQAGAVVELDGETVGEVGSAVFSHRLGAVVGLAVLHRKAIERGTTVEVVGGGRMQVEEPGFAMVVESKS